MKKDTHALGFAPLSGAVGYDPLLAAFVKLGITLLPTATVTQRKYQKRLEVIENKVNQCEEMQAQARKQLWWAGGFLILGIIALMGVLFLYGWLVGLSWAMFITFGVAFFLNIRMSRKKLKSEPQIILENIHWRRYKFQAYPHELPEWITGKVNDLTDHVPEACVYVHELEEELYVSAILPGDICLTDRYFIHHFKYGDGGNAVYFS